MTYSNVSIHAPTRGATSPFVWVSEMVNVSIHAPTRGATEDRTKLNQDKTFQSTHPHGVRQKRFASIIIKDGFNPRTHTGCDFCVVQIRQIWESFNPRTHTGCDSKSFIINDLFKCFNPRTHTGCDVALCLGVRNGQCFNPRTHTGCDRG